MGTRRSGIGAFVALVVGVALVAPAAAATGQAPATVAAEDSSDVASVVRRYHEALARGDSTGALALLAPDAVVLESGGLESLAEYRSHHLASDIEFARSVPETRSAIRVTVHGDAAWASSTTSAKGTFRGRPVDSSGAELMVLTRLPHGWRIAAVHWSSRRRS